MAKFFEVCFLPKSLRYFCCFEKGKSVEILRKVNLSRDFLTFLVYFDEFSLYPLRRSPYCVGGRNKDVSRQPYGADKYNKENHAQEGGIVRSLPLTKTFEPFSEAENKNCIDKEQRKRPAGSRRCSMAGRYAWYPH